MEAHDRVPTTDGGHAAEVAVAERRSRRLAFESPSDRPRDVVSLLHRHLGDAGQPGERHRVADDEDLGVARQRAVGSNGDPARTVTLRSGCLGQDAREGRGLHAGRPDDRVRGDALLAVSETRRPCRRRRCSSHASRCGSRRRCARARSRLSRTARSPNAPRICLSASKRSTAALVGSIVRKSSLERPARELGDLSGDLATGRPAADHGKGEPRAGARLPTAPSRPARMPRRSVVAG